MQENKNKLPNQLRLARKRMGMQQKQVAYLLKQKTSDQISRYEKGLRIPGLRLLLRLEIIYGVPARVLYRELYEELRAEVELRSKSLNILTTNYVIPTDKPGLFSEFCFYEELLRTPYLTMLERDRIRKHVVILMQRLARL